MSANISTTVYNWLREMKIPVSKTYLKHQLLSHPDYPSLLSITDSLNELGIENTAVHIEKEQLHDVPIPFLAHLNDDGGEFCVVRNKKQPDQEVPGFFNRWSGVVVAAEKPENWHHKLNAEWRNKDSKKTKTLLLTLSILTVLIFLSSIISFDWMRAALLLIAAGGVFVSWMIVSKDLGIENKIADQVCGKDADCNSVIHSNIAKLPFDIGWSDAGIIYFPFLLLALLIASFNNSLTSIYLLLVLLAGASIPLSIVSIYYQWKVIKKWCRLCLVTVALLWLQIIVLLPETINLLKYGFGKMTLIDVVQVSFILFLTTAVWLWVKPMIKENKKQEGENFEAKRFKRNPDIFNALLEKQKKLNIKPEGLGITIGNPTAENTIVKVCNPYCGPCAEAHPIIDDLLERNDNVKVQIIFTAKDDEKDIKAKPVKHFMALYEKNNKLLIKKALDDWYLANEKDYEAFSGKYKLNGELEMQREKLKAMRIWCDEQKINFTPTFFINDYQLPRQYNVKDLKYFLLK
jgi:thiol-disulfide isomerase/thioredoxin